MWGGLRIVRGRKDCGVELVEFVVWVVIILAFSLLFTLFCSIYREKLR